MSAFTIERYSYLVEYNDPVANLTHKYNFVYYLSDHTIEMYDLKTRKTFLKRCQYPELTEKELFIGATINVFSRPLKIVDYGDERTREIFTRQSGKIFIVVNKYGLCKLGSIIDALITRNLRITSIHMTYADSEIMIKCIPTLNMSTAQTTENRERCVLILVNGSQVVEKTNEVCNTFEDNVISIPGSLEQDLLANTVLSSSETTATCNHCAICVIKPHAITSSHQGIILQRLIDEGFNISALGSFALSVADAEDFLQVYSGVLPEYKRLVEQLASGTC